MSLTHHSLGLSTIIQSLYGYGGMLLALSYLVRLKICRMRVQSQTVHALSLYMMRFRLISISCYIPMQLQLLFDKMQCKHCINR